MASRAQNLGKLARIVLEDGTLGLTAATITITDSSYVAIPDLAVRPTGGYIKIIGTGFVSGCTLYINNLPATSTTFISATEVRAQLPALAVGSYSLMLFNTATVVAIWASGIIYSAAPVWGTTAYSNFENVVNTQLLATGDSTLTYTLASGTLPTGVTLSSSGLLSGTASEITSSTTVTFTVAVSDAQSQANPQLISLSLIFYVGKLYAWGQNNRGQLGDGSTVNKSSPSQIGSLTNWLHISATNASSSIIKTDGTLWTWGYNASGELGLGNTTNYSSPKQVGALTNWKSVSSGRSYVVALKTDGTLWAWGYNQNYGNLGDGTKVNKSSPVQIGSLTTWLSITAGGYHTTAIKTDGTLWIWGGNWLGQLGLGNTTYYSSPKQVGSLTNWKSTVGGYVHNVAIKTDGTLWTWGSNAQGNLGDGTTVDKSSPIQIGALTTWSKVPIGVSNHSIVIKTDGTLWSWGNNADGQLGDGTIINRSSPIQLGTLTTWSKTTTGFSNTIAIKTDGTLWAWGFNYFGQLGLGTSGVGANKSSPIQVGTLTTWINVVSGGNHTLALSS